MSIKQVHYKSFVNAYWDTLINTGKLDKNHNEIYLWNYVTYKSVKYLVTYIEWYFKLRNLKNGKNIDFPDYVNQITLSEAEKNKNPILIEAEINDPIFTDIKVFSNSL